MKAVIIGGGIAGLAAGLFLKRKGIEIVINERFSDFQDRGHGFLLHPNGLAILRELNPDKQPQLPGVAIKKAYFRTPDQTKNEAANLNSWRCMRRCDIIEYLYNLHSPGIVKQNRDFVEFKVEDGKVVAAVFSNNEVEYGDIFIGADGAHSKVRNYINNGETKFSATLVNEIVGVAENREMAATYKEQFMKFQDQKRGLAFGFIPLDNKKLVWFIQYDVKLINFDGSTPEKLKEMCYTLLQGFPEVAFDILRNTDFTKPYIWKTKDFNLIPTFHQNNVVVIGDAAHLALPFTSAGATNALVDAKMLGECISKSRNYDEVFSEFYILRSQVITLHVQLGRELQKRFLHPDHYTDLAPAIPLIA